jgi:hypothetical protein
MAAIPVCEILSVLKERREYCRELLKLSRAQRRLIDLDNYAALLDVLGRKQRILGSLDSLSRRNPDFKQVWRNERDGIAPELREECEHVLAETEALFGELLEEETDSTEHLTRRRDDTRKQLQSVSQGPHVHAAYRDSLGPSTHRHLDIDQ